MSARRAALGVLGGVVAVCAMYLLFFHRLGERGLWSSHEARAAQDAQRMLDDGRWGLPRLFDDQPDLQKPPLYYWLVAGFGRLNGSVDAWAVRTPAALAAVGSILVVFLGLRGSRPVAAVVAATVLATSLHFTWLARVGRIDLPLAFAVTAAVFAFRAGGLWVVAGYCAVAVGVMLKGPLGAVLPALVLGTNTLVAKTGNVTESFGKPTLTRAPFRSLIWGVPLVLGLALPWYVWADRETGGEFIREFVVKHNVNRFFGGDEGETPHAQAGHPWWFYGPVLTRDALPWTPVAFIAAVWFFRRGRWRADADARLGLVWLLVAVALFSCSRFKRADYLARTYPGLALFLGTTMERWWSAQSIRVRQAAATAFAVAVTGCVAGWGVFVAEVLPGQDAAHDCRQFAAAIRHLVPPPGVVLFFRAESHPLAFQLGRPLNTFREWENLDIWAGRPGTHYIIMPPDAAADWPHFLRAGRLEEVARLPGPDGDSHRTLVLMRTRPNDP